MDNMKPNRIDDLSARTRSASTIHNKPTTNVANKPKKSKKLLIIHIIAVVLVVSLLIGGWFVCQLKSVSSQIDSNKYQAVFLTNGQVYFGKLNQVNDGYFNLKDVFYLQTKTTDKSTNPQKTETNLSDIQLIKLGDEIHGPNDQMTISKEEVLFFENLKDEGKVSQSIKSYHKN